MARDDSDVRVSRRADRLGGPARGHGGPACDARRDRPGSVARHLLFVAINLALGALLVWRHRWAFWPTLALAVQQLYSHGLDLSQSFLGTAPLDKASLAVCLFFPTLLTLLYMERQEEAS